MPCRLPALLLCTALGWLGMGSALAADKAASAPATSSKASQASQAKPAAKKPPPPAKLVDINSASKEELKSLPGIGDAEAERIIKARPYPSKAKLGADKVISDQLYAGLQGKIVAAQPPPSKAKSDTKSSAKP